MKNSEKIGVWNNELEQRANTVVEKIQAHVIKKNISLDGFKYKKCGYKSGTVMPVIDDTFIDFKKTDKWGNEVDSHAWFYKRINFEKGDGRCEFSLKTNKTGWAANNPQFMLYFDGKIVQGMDVNHTSAVVNTYGEKDVYIYAYTSGAYVEPYDFIADVIYVDEETERLYYNLVVPTLTLKLLEGKTEEYQTLLKYINKTISLIDMREWYSEEYYNSVKKANEFIEKEFYKKVCKESTAKVACVGHTHIDIAWLWTVRQTIEKAQRSFATVLALMDRFEDYQFMSSQAVLYKAVKDENPELYERIKERVKEGRWQVEGATYVEMDTNLTSGESLVRHFLYGKRFFKNEFDVDCKTLWLPDVFGYSAALPQIMKKSGVDKFVTAKIGWNESNVFPYDSYFWRGIDGSEVFTHYITAKNYEEHPTGDSNPTTYVAQAYPRIIKGAYNRYHHKDINNEALVTMGYGDGGGGTTPYDCESVKRLKCGIPGLPTASFKNVNEYLNDVKKKFENNPRTSRWVGELYLEYHRGTYTSQARIKKQNRKTEFMLGNIENLGVLGEVKGLYSYDKENLYKYWEKALVNQFHDIVPGSSISDVYRDSDIDYTETFEYGNVKIDSNLKILAENVSKKGVLVYNPNPFKYSGAVNFNGKNYYVTDIPSKGYKVVELKEESLLVKVSEKMLENKFFKVKFDKNYNIVSVYDKSLKRELLKKGKAIRYVGYEDFPIMYDAWEIPHYFKEKEYLVDDVVNVETFYENDRAGLKITRKFVNSTLESKVYLLNSEKYLGFDDSIDWNTEHVFLKREFPIDVVAEKATCEIQFGNLERPTHKNTPWDQAKFEICAHKFVDVSETDYGVAIVNDCKYGYSVTDNDIGLSLIKCSTYPDPNADKGKHEIKYAMYPHCNEVNSSSVQEFAYKFNNPAMAVESKGNGSLDSEYSLVSCNQDNVFVDTVKLAEDGNDIIVRLFDAKRASKKATLTFGFDVKEAYLCDLLENNLKKVKVNGNKVTVSVKPFEIVTLKLVTK